MQKGSPNGERTDEAEDKNTPVVQLTIQLKISRTALRMLTTTAGSMLISLLVALQQNPHLFN